MLLLLARLAYATDVWSAPSAGVSLLERTTSEPNQVYAAFVDLTHPQVSIRTSQEGERQTTTSAFANATGAVVAVNGDWFSYSDYYPLGLAMGRGWQWTGQDDTTDWSFLACTIYNSCWINSQNTYEAVGPRFWSAVGGNGVPLVVAGAAVHNGDSFYCCEPEPRTAVGIDVAGTQLILVVVDGRRSSSVGATYNGMADLMAELGSYSAMMLDGGGSSTMVVNGSVRNDPSDGSERTVSNPFGVVVSSGSDSACAGHENTKYCSDATNMVACEGGTSSTGDCGYYGASCADDGEFAWCVDYRCPTPDGQAAACSGETTLSGCIDGQFGEGDCAVYGAACVEGYGTAWCAYTYFQGEYVGGTLGIGGEITVEVGETATGTVQLLNTGLTPWEPGIVFLAPTPRDVASAMADASWASTARVGTLAASVAPGQTGEFTVTVGAPTAGDYVQTFSLVAEGLTWFADYPTGGGPSDSAMVLTLHVVEAGEDSPAGEAPTSAEAPGGAVPLGGSGDCGCDNSGLGGTGVIATTMLLAMRRANRPRRST